MISERIILGIDPGTNVLGYGVLKITGKDVEMVTMGVIDMRRVSDIYLKLGRIHERVMGIIDSFKPDELAIESPFFGKNPQTMLKLGRAQGVCIAAAITRDVPIHEYAPMEIKRAITGRGAAAKEQVAEMLKRQLRIPQETLDSVPFLDATDALAAAYCHHLNTNSPMTRALGTKKKSNSWAAFVQANKNRIHS